MSKLWICLLLVAAAGAGFAAKDDSDEYYDDMDQWYKDEIQKMDEESQSREELIKNDDNIIKGLSSASQNDDYQIEDNRFIAPNDQDQETRHILADNDVSKDVDNYDNFDTLLGANEEQTKVEKETNDLLKDTDSRFEEMVDLEDVDQNLEAIPVPNDTKQPDPQIVNETEDLLKNEDSKMPVPNDTKQPDPQIVNETEDLLKNEDSKMPVPNDTKQPDPQIVNETEDLLKNEDSKMVDENLNQNQSDEESNAKEQDNKIGNSNHDNNSNFDTIPVNYNGQQPDPQIYKETENLLQDDISKMSDEDSRQKNDDTKLEQQHRNDDTNDNLEPIIRDNKEPDERIAKEIGDLLKNENTKMEEPNKESNFDNLNDDLKAIFDEANKNSAMVNDEIFAKSSENVIDKSSDSNESDDANIRVYDDINDDLNKLMNTLQKLSNNNNLETSDSKATNEVLDYEEKYDRPFGENDVLQQRQIEDDIDSSEAQEKNKLENDEIKAILYGDDSFPGDEETNKQKVKKDLINPLDSDETGSLTHEKDEKIKDEILNELMAKFIIDHADVVDVDGKNFNKNVGSTHIELNYEAPITICSPDYPNNYPNENYIKDWIFDGDGMGIELNMTELDLNGLSDDFLLIKPGGVDDSNHGGLVFSYYLNTERHYRFMDVDRMFVRFQTHYDANNQNMDVRRFCFSAKFMGPRPRPAEPEPEPEPQVPEVIYIHTVFLGAVKPHEFVDIREAFRVIVADMATLYINVNNIKPGEMSVFEVTNITRVSICNIMWPNYEDCSAVTFGVPLKYTDPEDENRLTSSDLRKMWATYSDVEPFASRIRELGATNFEYPNDRTTLMVWLVIGFGILLSAAMLALALRRWNCFEDYTRMASFNDTDSMSSIKKRDLDLFPTPHQIDLPPVYPENYGYNWNDDAGNDGRVDLGGFPNQGYVIDGDLFDIDSDEEDVSRNSHPTFQKYASNV